MVKQETGEEEFYRLAQFLEHSLEVTGQLKKSGPSSADIFGDKNVTKFKTNIITDISDIPPIKKQPYK